MSRSVQPDRARVVAHRAAAALGEDPHLSAWGLLEERVEKRDTPLPAGPATPSRVAAASPRDSEDPRADGVRNEEAVRAAFFETFVRPLNPEATVETAGYRVADLAAGPSRRWLVAQVDGIVRVGGREVAALEIKYHRNLAKIGGVPREYRAQVQVELLATGLETLYFVQSHRPARAGDPLPLHVTLVRRDPAFVREDVPVLARFREAVLARRRENGAPERERPAFRRAFEAAWALYAEAVRALHARRDPSFRPNVGGAGRERSPSPRPSPGPSSPPRGWTADELAVRLNDEPWSRDDRPEWGAIPYATRGHYRHVAWRDLLRGLARAHAEDAAELRRAALASTARNLPRRELRAAFFDAVDAALLG